MTIRFKKNYKRWISGDIVSRPPKTEFALIKDGIADDYTVEAAASRDPGISTITLFNSGVPIVIAPSGTVNNNGTFVLGTSLLSVYSSCFMYFPSGVLFSGSPAGFYYTEMNSLTNGTAYNNLYSPITGTPTIPSSPTGILAVGTGAFTGESNEISVAYATIKAGTMRKNSKVDFSLIGSHATTAGNKIYTFHFGGVQLHSSVATTSQTMAIPRYFVQNRGRLDRQISAGQATTGTSSATPSYLTINSANDVVVEIRLRHSVATDFIVLEAGAITMDVGNA